MNSRGNPNYNREKSTSRNTAGTVGTTGQPPRQPGHMQHTQSPQALAPKDQADLDVFRSALKELTFNSRPIIEKLTAMARERARTIPGPVSRTILDNLVFNNPKYRSCFLFLIDSIIKTVGDPFPASFVKHGLVSAYLRVFGEICAAGDEQQKRDFLRVLPTWHGVIAPEALGEIESKVGCISTTPIVTLPNVPLSKATVKFSNSTIKLLTDLKDVFVNPPGPRISGIVSEIFKRLDKSGEVSRDLLADLDFKAKQVDKRSIIDTLKQLINENELTTSSNKSNVPPTVAPLNFELPPNFQIDLSLLSSIVELNKLNNSDTSLIQSPSKKPLDKHFIDIPVNYSDMLVSRANLFKVLYDDLSLHCKTCGIRFRDTEQGHQRMTAHLDSHFRRNMRLKEKSKRVMARDWFGSEEDWISGKEDSESTSEKTVNVFEDSSTFPVETDSNLFVEATEEEQSSQIKCSTCQETISVVWNDEMEQWIFPACVRNEYDQIIHVTCQTTAEDTKRIKLK